MSTILCIGCLIACNRNAEVVSPAITTPPTVTGTAEVISENEDDSIDAADQYTGDTDAGAKVASYAVWFQLRLDYNGSLSNNQTIKVWDMTKSKSKWDQLYDAQGNTSNSADYFLDSSNLPAGVLPASPTKTFTTKKPGAQLYKKLTLKAGYYVFQTDDASTPYANRWYAFQVADKEMRFSTAYNNATDGRDGWREQPGRLKISIWNGAYKPGKVSVCLVPYEGTTDLAYYNALDNQFLPVVVDSQQGSGTKKACTYSQLSGDYVALYALSSDDIAEGRAIGLQRVTITPGSKYPHLKISFATDPTN